MAAGALQEAHGCHGGLGVRGEALRQGFGWLRRRLQVAQGGVREGDSSDGAGGGPETGLILLKDGRRSWKSSVLEGGME